MYLCSENKGADQLRGTDLHLCFRICKKQVFSRRGSIAIKAPAINDYVWKSVTLKLRYNYVGRWYM